MRISRIAVLAVLLVSGAAIGSELHLPHHKPGLWENDMVVNGKAQSNQQCFDDASEQEMLALSRKHCPSRSVVHNPDGSWTTIGTCEFSPGVTRTSRSDISGDFNSKLTIVTQSSGSTIPKVTMTATWLGACKPGQRGGDTITASGATVNMIDLMKSGAVK